MMQAKYFVKKQNVGNTKTMKALLKWQRQSIAYYDSLILTQSGTNDGERIVARNPQELFYVK